MLVQPVKNTAKTAESNPMKKVLYLSNIEVPYRARVFNGLAEHCDLTVLYERKRAEIRNKEWTKSEKSNYNRVILGGINLRNENAFSLKILKYIFGGYDTVIVGCFNSPVQMFAILTMRLFRKKYILNIDGEVFLNGNGLKTKLKKFFLKGADSYLAAGKKCAESLSKAVGNKKIYSYNFSSLNKCELEEHSAAECKRGKTVLVVGQYLPVKGIDVALEAAKTDSSIKYKFIGMGDRTDLFINDFNAKDVENVEFIPFLKKEDLEEEYKKCGVFVLPSRQECWGLVINEAASFGTPIVSTYGSGAAVEFLDGEYSRYLATSGNSEELYNCIKSVLNSDDNEEYSRYLIKKSADYSIEKGVSAIIEACGIEV